VSGSGVPERSLVSGWGRAAPTVARITKVTSLDKLEQFVLDHSRGGNLLARGLGRSYGDAAQCAGGDLVDCTGCNRIIDVDSSNAVVRAEAGVDLATLLREIVPQGLFVPVTPGTKWVTLGGAVAADVHGKNHHRDGAIGSAIEGLVLVTVDGRREIGPQREPELFWATVGGMGLTGVIGEASLRLIPIETAFMRVDTHRVDDLDACMSLLSEGDTKYRYSVAWLDAAASGVKLGRAVVTQGDHALVSDLSGPTVEALSYEPPRSIGISFEVPGSLVNSMTTAIFNELWFRKAPKARQGELQTFDAFFYPLDRVASWNRIYGPHGFTQYQFVVPFESADAVRSVIERIQDFGVSPSLAVLKRFGESDPAPLSFPMPGWTLALDVPLGKPGLSTLFDELDLLVAQSGGRVYLAKDGRLRPSLLSSMYPRIESWRETRRLADPDGRFASDLSRRLNLAGTHSAAPA